MKPDDELGLFYLEPMDHAVLAMGGQTTEARMWSMAEAADLLSLVFAALVELERSTPILKEIFKGDTMPISFNYVSISRLGQMYEIIVQHCPDSVVGEIERFLDE